MPVVRRKRNEDGSLGELENVFGRETDKDKIDRFEFDNANLTLESVNKDLKITSLEEQFASLTLELIMKGVL